MPILNIKKKTKKEEPLLIQMGQESAPKVSKRRKKVDPKIEDYIAPRPPEQDGMKDFRDVSSFEEVIVCFEALLPIEILESLYDFLKRLTKCKGKEGVKVSFKSLSGCCSFQDFDLIPKEQFWISNRHIRLSSGLGTFELRLDHLVSVEEDIKDRWRLKFRTLDGLTEVIIFLFEVKSRKVKKDG